MPPTKGVVKFIKKNNNCFNITYKFKGHLPSNSKFLNSLNHAELVINKLTKSISKKVTNITFFVRFIIVYSKDFRSL